MKYTERGMDTQSPPPRREQADKRLKAVGVNASDTAEGTSYERKSKAKSSFRAATSMSGVSSTSHFMIVCIVVLQSKTPASQQHTRHQTASRSYRWAWIFDDPHRHPHQRPPGRPGSRTHHRPCHRPRDQATYRTRALQQGRAVASARRRPED